MTSVQKPVAAFAVSLVAGALMVAGGVMGLAAWTWWRWMPMWGWMTPMWGMMGSLWLVFSSLGLVSGAVVLAAALLMYSRPEQAQSWGTVILVFSAVSLLGMGGFVIGAVLGIMGGVLAMVWKT
ncbi:MAG: hypothetical protein NZ957_01410 [Thaumarchaeota archaeon]|nr:hypothetical protein [Candidatus Calditenuaceae archaeon]MDW8042402.1 hypothetical protein [Nitrososphaerota archaeon]